MKVQWQIANEFGKKILVGKPFTIQDELSHGFDAFDGSTMDADEAVILFGNPTEPVPVMGTIKAFEPDTVLNECLRLKCRFHPKDSLNCTFKTVSIDEDGECNREEIWRGTNRYKEFNNGALYRKPVDNGWGKR